MVVRRFLSTDQGTSRSKLIQAVLRFFDTIECQIKSCMKLASWTSNYKALLLYVFSCNNHLQMIKHCDSSKRQCKCAEQDTPIL